METLNDQDYDWLVRTARRLVRMRKREAANAARLDHEIGEAVRAVELLRYLLGGRLERSDELARARAELARIDAIATLRREWIALRSEFAELAIAYARTSLRKELVAGAARTVEAARMLAAI